MVQSKGSVVVNRQVFLFSLLILFVARKARNGRYAEYEKQILKYAETVFFIQHYCPCPNTAPLGELNHMRQFLKIPKSSFYDLLRDLKIKNLIFYFRGIPEKSFLPHYMHRGPHMMYAGWYCKGIKLFENRRKIYYIGRPTFRKSILKCVNPRCLQQR